MKYSYRSWKTGLLAAFLFVAVFGISRGALAACTVHNAVYGDTVNGTLDTGDCQEDPYAPGYYDEKILFSGSAGDSVWFDVAWPDSSGYFLLVDDSDSSIIQEDGVFSSGSGGFGLYTLPTTGSYTIWVTTWNNYETGDYSFTISTPGSYNPDELRYGWTKAVYGGSSGGSEIRGYSIAYDSTGNIYVAGRFYESMDFDPGPLTDTKTGVDYTYDGFLTKYDSNGDYQWTRVIAGTGYDSGNSVAVDSSGDVYVAGSFEGTVDFDPGVNVENHISAGYGAFLSKYDSSGNYLWTKTTQGSGNAVAYYHFLDSSGTMYVAGCFSGSVDFDPTGTGDVITSSGGGTYDDMSITKYGAGGSYLWTSTVAGACGNLGKSITSDASGNIYATGYYSSGGMFLAKFNSGGNLQWTDDTAGGSAYGSSVVANSSGDIYVTGYFTGTVDFDPTGGTDNKISRGDNDISLSKYGSDGSYIWTKTTGGSGDDQPISATLDSSGNMYITGYFRSTMDFDPGSDVDIHSANSEDLFLTKLASNGDYLWTKSLQGSDYEEGNSVSADASGNVYLSGNFYGTVDFDPGITTDEVSIGGGAFFLTKYGPLGGGGGGGGGGGDNGGGGGTNLDGSKYSYNYFNTNLDINSTIALSCDPSVTMNALVGTGQSAIDANNQANCTVTTNNSNGYKMEWHASTDAMLNAQNDPFPAYSPSASIIPETWTVPATTSAWGAKLAATSEGYNGGAGGSGYSYPGTGWGSDDSYMSGKFLNVATTPFQIMQKSTETDVDGELQSIMFAAEIGADKIQPTGTYTTQVTVTATTL